MKIGVLTDVLDVKNGIKEGRWMGIIRMFFGGYLVNIFMDFDRF